MGLARPWVKVRAIRYDLENLQLVGDVDFSTIVQETSRASGTGDALSGLLDLEGMGGKYPKMVWVIFELLLGFCHIVGAVIFWLGKGCRTSFNEEFSEEKQIRNDVMAVCLFLILISAFVYFKNYV